MANVVQFAFVPYDPSRGEHVYSPVFLRDVKSSLVLPPAVFKEVFHPRLRLLCHLKHRHSIDRFAGVGQEAKRKA